MVGHKRERVLGRVGRAVDAAARDFAREAAQLENGGGREAAAERLVEQQVEVSRAREQGSRPQMTCEC